MEQPKNRVNFRALATVIVEYRSGDIADVRLRHTDLFSNGHLGDTREGDRSGYTSGWRRGTKNGQLSLGEHPGDDDTRGTTTELSNTRIAATSEDT